MQENVEETVQHLTIGEFTTYKFKPTGDESDRPDTFINGLTIYAFYIWIYNCIIGGNRCTKKHKGLSPGMLRYYNPEMAKKEFYRYTIKKIYKIGSKESALGKPVVSFLKQVDDGLIFVLVLYFIMFIFVATTWLLLTRIDSVRHEIESQNFSGAFYPITFFIAIIAGGNLKRAMDHSTAESKKYLDVLFLIEWISNVIFTIYQNTFGVDIDARGNLIFRNEERWKVSEDMQIWRRKEAEIQRKRIKYYLLTIAYHIYATFGNNDLHLDANYFQFAIYKGEALLNRDRIRHNTEGSSRRKYKDDSCPMPKRTFFRSTLYNELLQQDTELSCDEKIIIEYHMAEEIRRKYFPYLHIIRGDSLHIVKQAIENILGLLSDPIYRPNHISIAQDHLHKLFEQITKKWTHMQVQEPQMYGVIFNVILFFYLGILVPLQVISNTNAYWGLFIIPIIIMIYLAPIIVSNWIGEPFRKNKFRVHPPHRQYRGLLCEKIANMFGDGKRVVYSSDHHNFVSYK